MLMGSDGKVHGRYEYDSCLGVTSPGVPSQAMESHDFSNFLRRNFPWGPIEILMVSTMGSVGVRWDPLVGPHDAHPWDCMGHVTESRYPAEL